jgi:glycine hydroxymethyltransferase
MGESEMKEIASIIALVLNHTKPLILTKGANAGQPSKAKAVTEEGAMREAQGRVLALLEKFKLYPELDLPFLEKHFPLDNNER